MTYPANGWYRVLVGHILALNKAYSSGAGLHSVLLLADRVPWINILCVVKQNTNTTQGGSSQLINSQKSTHQGNLTKES